MNILIDIGHAAHTGAKSLDGKYEEHTLCGVLGIYLKRALIDAGHTARIIDYPALSNADDLRKTAQEINATPGVTCGVSLHMDAASTYTPRGAHVCYYSASGQRLATAISHHLCSLLPGRAEHIVRRTDLYILKHTKPVWVLCECGFITSPPDLKIILDAPQSVASAIAQGIVDYNS